MKTITIQQLAIDAHNAEIAQLDELRAKVTAELDMRGKDLTALEIQLGTGEDLKQVPMVQANIAAIEADIAKIQARRLENPLLTADDRKVDADDQAAVTRRQRVINNAQKTLARHQDRVKKIEAQIKWTKGEVGRLEGRLALIRRQHKDHDQQIGQLKRERIAMNQVPEHGMIPRDMPLGDRGAKGGRPRRDKSGQRNRSQADLDMRDKFRGRSSR
jgi:chromosome segregation ATPase